MTFLLRCVLLFVLVLGSGCFAAHDTADPGARPTTDAGTRPPPTTRPPPPPPPPPRREVPPLVRGALSDECDLRGRSRFVIVPDSGVGFEDVCDAEPATYLAIETRMLGESTASLRVSDERVSVTLCHEGDCTDAVEGDLEIFVARGEVATVTYDVRFPDGTRLADDAEITNFCNFCPSPESFEGRAITTCAPDDGPGWTFELGLDDPLTCGGRVRDGVILTIYEELAGSPPGTFFDLPSPLVSAQVCTAGRCTEGLEGTIRIDSFERGEYASGEFVFFAAPGTDFSGRFWTFNWCADDVVCG